MLVQVLEARARFRIASGMAGGVGRRGSESFADMAVPASSGVGQWLI